jgi:hypothetical protein
LNFSDHLPRLSHVKQNAKREKSQAIHFTSFMEESEKKTELPDVGHQGQEAS